MPPWQPRILTAVPQHWPVRMEIVKAIRTLAAELEEEKQLRKRTEAAEAQRRQDDLRHACDEAVKALHDACRALRKYGFNPNEPRVPAGHREGGQWTKEDRGAAPNASTAMLSDATRDNTWRPSPHYVANEPAARGFDYNGHPLLEESWPEVSQARVAQELADSWSSSTQGGFGQIELTGSGGRALGALVPLELLARALVGQDAHQVLLTWLMTGPDGKMWSGNITGGGLFGRGRPDLLYDSKPKEAYEIKPSGAEAAGAAQLARYLRAAGGAAIPGSFERIFGSKPKLTLQSSWFFGRTTYTYSPSSYPGVVTYTVENTSVFQDIFQAFRQRPAGGPSPLPLPPPPLPLPIP
jgi:hypothetical protein